MKGNKPRPDKIGLADEIVKRHANLPGQEAKPIRGEPLQVQMINEGSIRVEIFKGLTDATAFTAAGKTYER